MRKDWWNKGQQELKGSWTEGDFTRKSKQKENVRTSGYHEKFLKQEVENYQKRQKGFFIKKMAYTDSKYDSFIHFTVKFNSRDYSISFFSGIFNSKNYSITFFPGKFNSKIDSKI